jgi:hypothetical protein
MQHQMAIRKLRSYFFCYFINKNENQVIVKNDKDKVVQRIVQMQIIIKSSGHWMKISMVIMPLLSA